MSSGFRIRYMLLNEQYQSPVKLPDHLSDDRRDLCKAREFFEISSKIIIVVHYRLTFIVQLSPSVLLIFT